MQKLVAIALLIASLGSSAAYADDWKANIDKARTMLKDNQPVNAEMLLRTTFHDAQKSKPHDQMYGRYMGLFANALYQQHKQKEMIPYAEDALNTFYSLPPDKMPPNVILFTNHSDLAMSYQSIGNIKQAEKHYFKAIAIAEKMPKSDYDTKWLKLCFENLITILHNEKKDVEEKKTKDEEKKIFG